MPNRCYFLVARVRSSHWYIKTDPLYGNRITAQMGNTGFNSKSAHPSLPNSRKQGLRSLVRNSGNFFSTYKVSILCFITNSDLNRPCFAWHPYGKSGLFKTTTGGEMLCLGPWVVALIISLPEHFSSWNPIIKLKEMYTFTIEICTCCK